MRHVSLILTSLLVLAGCEDTLNTGNGDGGGGNPPPDVAPCAVFFTELMADPDGADAESEFVELYNPGAEAVNIGGCRLELRAGEAGATKREQILGALEIPPGDYVVVGPEMAEAVNYNWRSLGALPNSSSGGTVTLSLVCGQGPVASVSYLAPEGEAGLGAPRGGRSFQLGANNLTCEAGKSAAGWCLSETESGDNFETRRQPNDECAGPPPDCTLAACGLFFTEVLADPRTDDSENEYVELYNPGDAPVRLNGCAIEIQKGEGEPKVHLVAAAPVVEVPAQDFVLLGPENATPVDYNWSGLGDLPNSSRTGAVTLRIRNPSSGEEVDSFTYLAGEDGLDGPARGRAFQLCRDTGFNCDGNDGAANWSVADVGAADAENLGTPGLANRPCVELTCNATACDGTVGDERRIVAPAVGDLVITEIYANPPRHLGSEAAFEWFEVYNAGERDLDLNGVEVWRRDNAVDADYTIGNGASCVTIPAGEYATFAANADPAQNDGISVCAGFGYGRGFSLVNSNGYLSLRIGGTIIDEVSWGRSTDGRSIELSPTCDLTAEANDDPACWCFSQRPAPGGVELVYHTAGEANEACDACYCSVGVDWRKADRIFRPGELSITEYLSDVPGNEADNPGWEFVEIRANAAGQLNCGGVGVGDGVTEFPWTECVELAAGEHLTLARSGDPAANGGLSEATTREVAFSRLRAEGGRLAIVAGGAEIDVVDDYPGGDNGVAVQKDAVSGAWCEATEQYSFDPDAFGTPGADNTACP